jgi:hypothetical protein
VKRVLHKVEIISLTIGNQVFSDHEIIDHVPNSLFNTKFHFDSVSDLLVILSSNGFLNGISPYNKEIYINFFAFKIPLGRIYTAALKLIELGKANVVSVNELFFPHLSQVNVVVFSTKFRIDIGITRKIIFLKYSVNKLFSFLNFIFINDDRTNVINILKAWVEVSLRIHGVDRFQKSRILVYPFPYSFRRQIEFIKKLCHSKYEFRFGFVDYSFSDFFYLLIRMKIDEYLKFEINGESRSAFLLLKKYPSLKNLFTEDDYVPAIFAFNNLLISNGITVVNTSHGVNQQVPMISSSIIEYLTDSQKNIYSLYSHNTIFKKQSNHSLKPKYTFKDHIDIAYIFIHGNFKESGMVYEDILQNRLLNQLVDLNIENLYIKYHPNSKCKKNEYIKSIDYSKMEELLFDKKLVFLTINSTSYFTFGYFGVFCFINDDFFNPCDIFGTGIITVNIKEINTILSFENHLNWTNAFKRQINYIEGNI